MIAFELRHTGHGVLLMAEGILVVAVVLRQFFVLTENQRLLVEVAREAFHDHLTGLANRANFLDGLERAMGRRRRTGEPVAVLCLDLDNFKSVNDALGHPAGDELLIRVAERLKSRLGETWTVARLGGDEFAALFEGHVDALAAANSVLDAFRTAIVIDGVAQLVRPSIGLTVAANKGDQTADDLLLNADLAMYAAKRDGGGCVRSFVPDLPVPWELQQLTDLPAAQRDSAVPPAGASAPRSADGGVAGKERSRGGRTIARGVGWAGCAGTGTRRLHTLDVVARPCGSHRAVRRRAVFRAEHLGGGVRHLPRLHGAGGAVGVPAHRSGDGEFRRR